MLSEREPKSARIENWPVFILLVIFITVLLMAICVVGVMLLSEMKETRPTPQQDIPVLLLLTETLPTPTAMQANHYSISFPMIRSGSESEQIWKVTKIDNLGYELSGQRYDLATFTRINSQDTAQGYCINPGWDIPDIGTEYVLTAGGTFVPLQESEADPFQRFLKIQ